MKKKIYLFIAALLIVCSSNVTFGQHITTHYYSDSCGSGGLFYVGLTGYVSGLQMETSFGDGTTATYAAYSGGASSYHIYTSSGTYTIKFVLVTSGGSRVDSISYSQLIMGCHFITARLYDDANNNCIFDAGDKKMYFPCSIQVDSGGSPIDTIGAYGDMVYRAYSLSATYKFTPINLPSTITMSCPSTGSLSATASSGGPVAAGDFGFHCSTATGFDVSVYSSNRAGRHSMRCMSIVVNNSCTPKSGTFTMTMDSRYTYNGSSPAGGTVSGNTVTWSYTNVNVDSPAFFEVWGERSPYLTPGTAVYDTAFTTHITGDGDIANDTSISADTVNASFDPNEKQVTPTGAIKAGTRLTYTLSFENTGNAPALNIYILDTLSSYLDVQSLQILGASHAMTLNKLIGPGGTNIIRFDFANINLPDSTHHGQADGFVTFSINTNKGLPIGTLINNKASIYFDDNDPVVTNTVSNTISNVAVPVLSSNSQVSIYPNPAHNEFTIKTDKGTFDNAQIINSMGQILLEQKLLNTETHLNIKSLSPGIYYIMLKGAQGIKVEKTEKL